MYHKIKPNVGKYTTIHHTWIVYDCMILYGYVSKEFEVKNTLFIFGWEYGSSTWLLRQLVFLLSYFGGIIFRCSKSPMGGSKSGNFWHHDPEVKDRSCGKGFVFFPKDRKDPPMEGFEPVWRRGRVLKIATFEGPMILRVVEKPRIFATLLISLKRKKWIPVLWGRKCIPSMDPWL